jgi:hypothetical protein
MSQTTAAELKEKSLAAGPETQDAPTAPDTPEIIIAARPNPYNRGNCFQWKNCLGETMGNMWIEAPNFCGPLGGKSWKGEDGRCINLMEPPWNVDPKDIGQPE